MTPKSDIRISISNINGGKPFHLIERPDLWRRVYDVNPTLFEDEDPLKQVDEIQTDIIEPKDWSGEEVKIIYEYFDEGKSMREINEENDEYTYKYVQGVINAEKERRNETD